MQLIMPCPAFTDCCEMNTRPAMYCWLTTLPTTWISYEGSAPLYGAPTEGAVSRPGCVLGSPGPGTGVMWSFSASPVWLAGTMSVGTSGLFDWNRSAHVSGNAGICRMVLQGMVILWPFTVTVPPARRGDDGTQMASVVSSVASWMKPVMS